MWNRMQSVPLGKSALGRKILVIAFSCLISASAFSQNITNTLGTGGVFYIKDSTTNYFTLTQSTGEVNILKSLRLENTTDPNLGVIFKGADRFMHNYGLFNTFMGINAGNFTMTGGDNTGVGWNSLNSNTSGYYNTALGLSSLYSNTTGYENTAVGLNSLAFNTTGYYNTAMGSYSLFSNTTGNYNAALGHNSLSYNTTGFQNTAIGSYSLFSNTTGYDNIAIGNAALNSNTDGYENTAVGVQSLFSNTGSTAGNSHIWNTAVGFRALFSDNSSGNTALGHNAGSTNVGGVNLTCIGWNAQPSSSFTIGEITLGNQYINYLRCAVTAITALSDARDKKNIKDLNLGIDFLMKIKPRLFNWDKREWYENNISDGSKMKEESTAGFIAQELDEVQITQNCEWLNLVLKDNPEKLEATPGNLLPIVVKAIQDLNLKCEELKEENNTLKNNNEKLSAEVESLKSMSEKLVTLEQLISELTSIKQASFSVAK